MTNYANPVVCNTGAVMYTGAGTGYIVQTPAGVLYAVHSDSSTGDIYFVKSTDGGLSWGSRTVVSSAITIGFFVVFWELMHGAIPDAGRDTLLVMLGSLGAAWVSVVAYYFGSSSGSAKKTAALERAASSR